MELRINQILQDKGMKLSDLADKMGVDQSNLKRSLEKNPSLFRLEEVAKALEVNVQDLFPYQPSALSAGILKMGDRHFSLVSMDVTEPPYVFNYDQFYKKVEDFIYRCLKNGKTISICGVYKGFYPVSLIYDGESETLYLSISPTGDGCLTTVYHPKKQKWYVSDMEAVRDMARIIINEIEESL